MSEGQKILSGIVAALLGTTALIVDMRPRTPGYQEIPRFDRPIPTGETVKLPTSDVRGKTLPVGPTVSAFLSDCTACGSTFTLETLAQMQVPVVLVFAEGSERVLREYKDVPSNVYLVADSADVALPDSLRPFRPFAATLDGSRKILRTAPDLTLELAEGL